MIRRPRRSPLFPSTTLFRSLFESWRNGQPPAGDAPDLATSLRPQLDRLTQALVAALARVQDRKSTRLNSSHQIISYAVFCLKKKSLICGNVDSFLSDLCVMT